MTQATGGKPATVAVDVWWGSPADVHARHLALLDDVERARRERYHRDVDRDRFALGVVLTRVALGKLLGLAPADVPLERSCPTCGEPHGRPRLAVPAAGARVSVTHSGDRVGVAVAGGVEVGIDVEVLDTRAHLDRLAANVMHADEQAVFAAAPPSDRALVFVTYWTRKEAVVKATGDGLHAPLAGVHVTAPGDEPRLLGYAGRPDLGPVAMSDLAPGPGHLGCVAVVGAAAVTVRERPAAELLGG